MSLIVPIGILDFRSTDREICLETKEYIRYQHADCYDYYNITPADLVSALLDHAKDSLVELDLITYPYPRAPGKYCFGSLAKFSVLRYLRIEISMLASLSSGLFMAQRFPSTLERLIIICDGYFQGIKSFCNELALVQEQYLPCLTEIHWQMHDGYKVTHDRISQGWIAG